jgi:ketosteroid isomerase-like protein
MKRLLTLAFVIVAVCPPALGQKSVNAGEDFSSLIKRYYTAWSSLNPDNAAPLYAKDANLVFYDITPLKYSGGWQEYSDTFKKTVGPGFSSLTLTPNNDLNVTRRGNVALTTLTFHMSAKQKDGTPLEFDGRHTIVWEKRGPKWLIIHEHVSKPL